MKNLKTIATCILMLHLLNQKTIAQPCDPTEIIRSNRHQVIRQTKAERLQKNLYPRLIKNSGADIYTIGVKFAASVLAAIPKAVPLAPPNTHYGLLIYHGYYNGAYVVYLVNQYVYIDFDSLYLANQNCQRIAGSIVDVPFALGDIIRIDANGDTTTNNVTPNEVLNSTRDLLNQLEYEGKKPIYAVSFFHYKQIQQLLNAGPDSIKISLGKKPRFFSRFGKRLHTIVKGQVQNGINAPTNKLILDRNWPPSEWQ